MGYNITMKTNKTTFILIIWVCSQLVIFNNILEAKQPLPIVDLKEILRIEDTGEEFFFKRPSAPIVDNKGFIFVDDVGQLLLFSPKGEFIKNFFKKGQGPGELTSVNAVLPSDDTVMVFNRNPWKVVWFSRTGQLQRENRLSDKLGFSSYLTQYNGRYYFLKEKFMNTKNKAVYLDIDVEILSIGLKDKEPRDEKITFPKKYFVMNTNWIMNVYFVQTTHTGKHTVLIANNGNYDIKRLDLKEMHLHPFLKREHKKVKIKEEWKKILKPTKFPHYTASGKEYKVFERKALDDILRIWKNGDKTWILTSDLDEKTRLVRTDVYTGAGEYKGAFNLRMPDGIYLFKLSYTSMAKVGERLYVFEESEEGEIDLGGYDLLNIPAWAK